MKTILVKLTFISEVHFGHKRLSDSEQTIQADTLFSALFIEALQLGIDTQTFIDDLLLSDTLPYDTSHYYVPKPLAQIPGQEKNPNFKELKRLTYLPYEEVALYMKGGISSIRAKELNERFDIGVSRVLTKASIPRRRGSEANRNDESNLFTVGTFAYKKDAGLYFLARGSKRTLDLLENALHSLQYSGIGGKRSIGYGRFTYDILPDHPLTKLVEQKGTHYMLLSTAVMADEEPFTLEENDAYVVQKRTGFVQSSTYAPTLRKRKDLYTFKAGSVFANKFSGAIFDVSKDGDHPVYRYAKAFWLEVSK